MGHSRGGLTTKLHLAVDGKGRPLAVTLTPGQRHESTQLEGLLDGIRVPRQAARAGPASTGGGFRAVRLRLGASELTENRRQQPAREGEALELL